VLVDGDYTIIYGYIRARAFHDYQRRVFAAFFQTACDVDILNSRCQFAIVENGTIDTQLFVDVVNHAGNAVNERAADLHGCLVRLPYL
jgi:hypothetical protein